MEIDLHGREVFKARQKPFKVSCLIYRIFQKEGWCRQHIAKEPHPLELLEAEAHELDLDKLLSGAF